MSGNEAFEFVSERGWRRGMRNMLRNEFNRWWKSSMWWVQLLIWTGIIGILVSAMLFGDEPGGYETSLLVFSLFAGIFPAVAISIIMQDVLVGEKREGTAAWVLSKPVSRPAFLLPKVIANSVGVLATMAAAPCTMGFILFSIYQGSLVDPLRFIMAMGVFFVGHFFFLTFTLMLSTFFNNRGPVIGLSMTLIFMQQYIVGGVPALGYFLPWNLVVPLGEQPNCLVYSLLTGTPVQTGHLITLVVVLVESIFFILIGLWRFNKEEF